jgi:transposase
VTVDELELFQAALGLTRPWKVVKTKLTTGDEETLDIWIDFDPGSRFPCPECQAASPAYDTKETTWRHLDFFQYKAFLHARHPRVQCVAHGIHRVNVPWSRPESGFTFFFEAMVLAMAPHMPVAALARQVREHDTLVWRILHHHVDEARARADFSAVKAIGMDETSRQKGHVYVSLFVDLDESRVLFVTPGKDASTVGAFAKDLKDHGGDPTKIKDVCMDMSPAFKEGARTHLPEAEITFDRFHLTKLMNEAVDQVRREEQRESPGLKTTRYLWLHKNSNLTNAQKARVLDLSDSYEKTGRAYRLKESFLAWWQQPLSDSTAYLTGWYDWAIRSRLEPVRDFAKTVKRNWAGVVRWSKSHLANGVLEGINSLVQAAKAKARGYRSERNLATMTYLLAGKLDFKLPT